MATIDPDTLDDVTYVGWVDRTTAERCWAVALIVEVCPTEAEAAEATDRWTQRLGYVGPQWVRRERAATILGVGVKMIDKLRRGGRLRDRHVAITNRAYVLRDDLNAYAASRGKADRPGDET